MDMLLARKISRSKWNRARNMRDGFAATEIAADALTGDLRTRENKLSFWRCRSEASADMDDIVLAIAAAGDRVNHIDIAWIDADLLRSDGQILEASMGRTPVSDLRERHVDIARLDTVRLTSIAKIVAEAVDSGQIRRVRKADVKTLLVDALEDGRVVSADLTARLRADLGAPQ